MALVGSEGRSWKPAITQGEGRSRKPAITQYDPAMMAGFDQFYANADPSNMTPGMGIFEDQAIEWPGGMPSVVGRDDPPFGGRIATNLGPDPNGYFWVDDGSPEGYWFRPADRAVWRAGGQVTPAAIDNPMVPPGYRPLAETGVNNPDTMGDIRDAMGEYGILPVQAGMRPAPAPVTVGRGWTLR